MVEVNIQMDKMKKKLGETLDMTKYNKSKFQVFAWEAGTGKSTYTTECISAHLNGQLMSEEKLTTYLVVKKFNREIYEMEAQVRENLISVPNGDNLVIGLTSENFKGYMKRPELLNNAAVLIISHARYVELCKKELKAPFSNRDVLIIDEKVQFPTYEYTKTKYDDMRKLFPFSLQKVFDRLNIPLLEKLEILKESSNQIIALKITCDQIEWKKDIELLKKEIDSESVNEFLEELCAFYDTEILFNNAKFYVIDKKYKFRKLKNNIILDASAPLDPLYNGNDFKIVEQTKIIDYSKSWLIFKCMNSSITSWRNDKSLLNIFGKLSKYVMGEKRKTLIVSHKEQSEIIRKTLIAKAEGELLVHTSNTERIDGCKVELNWFGNIVGQNQYSDFNTCILAGTFNLPYPVYLLQYAMYNNISSFAEWNLTVKKGNFEDNTLEAVRKGYLAADFYQALKRVQRNLHPNAKILVLNKDKQLAELLCTQLTNINCIIAKVDKNEEYNNRTQGAKLKEWLLVQPSNVYHKSDVAEALAINKKNLSRVLKSPEIIGLIGADKIEIQRTKIVIK